jgi:hypothetical protein
MITQTTIELLLYASCALVWLGPTLSSALKRQASFMHPSFMVPAYMMFSVSVAMSEHWLHWSGRGTMPGIRTQTQALQGIETLFIFPLVILLVLGFVFHLGVWLGCGSIRPHSNDRVHLMMPHRPQTARSGALLTVICAIGMICCCLPYLVFGQGLGFFWTVPVYNCIPFLAFLATLYARRYSMLPVLLGLAAMLVYPSKQNFVFFFLPYVLFWQGSILWRGSVGYRVRRFKLLSLVLIVASACMLYYGTYFLIDLRHERDSGKSFSDYILLREYGFETFAVLTASVPFSGASDGGMYLARNAFDLIPSALLPFEFPKTRGEGGFAKLMPRDVKALPNAGFYRFFCFDAYYDFGIVGAVGYCFFFAFGLARFYRQVLRSTRRRGTAWPLVCYLPWPMYAQFWINGCIAFAASFSCFASAMIYLLGRAVIGQPRIGSYCASRKLLWGPPLSSRRVGAKPFGATTGESS